MKIKISQTILYSFDIILLYFHKFESTVKENKNGYFKTSNRMIPSNRQGTWAKRLGKNQRTKIFD